MFIALREKLTAESYKHRVTVITVPGIFSSGAFSMRKQTDEIHEFNVVHIYT